MADTISSVQALRFGWVNIDGEEDRTLEISNADTSDLSTLKSAIADFRDYTIANSVLLSTRSDDVMKKMKYSKLVYQTTTSFDID